MKQKFLFFLLHFFFLLIFFHPKVKAAESDCLWQFTDEMNNPLQAPFSSDLTKIKYYIMVNDTTASYTIKSCTGGIKTCANIALSQKTSSGRLTGTINIRKGGSFGQEIIDELLELHREGYISNPYCSYDLEWTTNPLPSQRSAECKLSLIPQNNITEQTSLLITGEIINVKGMAEDEYDIYCGSGLYYFCSINISGTISKTFLPIVDNNTKTFKAELLKGWSKGNYIAEANIQIKPKAFLTQPLSVTCKISFNVPAGVMPTSTPIPSPTLSPLCRICGQKGECLGECYTCPGCPGYTESQITIPELQPLCDQIHPDYKEACENCINRTDNTYVWTAVGCLPASISSLVNKVFFGIGLGIAGAVAFLYFLYGAFLVLTSAGNPEKIEQAKQIIISALSGLILIIFAVFLLKIIGVDILKIPGFSD